jgi:hypothetical protein
LQMGKGWGAREFTRQRLVPHPAESNPGTESVCVRIHMRSCVFVCVCAFAFICVHAFLCVPANCVCAFAFMRVRVHACSRSRVRVHLRVFELVCVFMSYACSCVRVCVHVRSYACSCIRVHVCSCVHMRVHAFAFICVFLNCVRVFTFICVCVHACSCVLHSCVFVCTAFMCVSVYLRSGYLYFEVKTCTKSKCSCDVKTCDVKSKRRHPSITRRSDFGCHHHRRFHHYNFEVQLGDASRPPFQMKSLLCVAQKTFSFLEG